MSTPSALGRPTGRPRSEAPKTAAQIGAEAARRRLFAAIVHGDPHDIACPLADAAIQAAVIAANEDLPFFTLKQLAARWQCSVKAVERFEIPRHKFGVLVRFARADVLEYEAQTRQIPQI